MAPSDGPCWSVVQASVNHMSVERANYQGCYDAVVEIVLKIGQHRPSGNYWNPAGCGSA